VHQATLAATGRAWPAADPSLAPTAQQQEQYTAYMAAYQAYAAMAGYAGYGDTDIRGGEYSRGDVVGAAVEPGKAGEHDGEEQGGEGENGEGEGDGDDLEQHEEGEEDNAEDNDEEDEEEDEEEEEEDHTAEDEANIALLSYGAGPVYPSMRGDYSGAHQYEHPEALAGSAQSGKAQGADEDDESAAPGTGARRRSYRGRGARRGVIRGRGGTGTRRAANRAGEKKEGVGKQEAQPVNMSEILATCFAHAYGTPSAATTANVAQPGDAASEGAAGTGAGDGQDAAAAYAQYYAQYAQYLAYVHAYGQSTQDPSTAPTTAAASGSVAAGTTYTAPSTAPAQPSSSSSATPLIGPVFDERAVAASQDEYAQMFVGGGGGLHYRMVGKKPAPPSNPWSLADPRAQPAPKPLTGPLTGSLPPE
jgi:hypothetical protein